MPFTYELQVPAELYRCGPARLVKWLLEEIEYFDAGTPLALLAAGERQYELLAQGPGLLFEQRGEAGGVVLPGDPVGLAAADGEPSGRPYVVARAI